STFHPFPFPDCSELHRDHIRKIAEELDAHRKRVQAQHPGLTLTGMYNVLEKLRASVRNRKSGSPLLGERDRVRASVPSTNQNDLPATELTDKRKTNPRPRPRLRPPPTPRRPRRRRFRRLRLAHHPHRRRNPRTPRRPQRRTRQG